MNRDFAEWSSLDLLPVSFTESRGIKYFFGKNFSNVLFPSRYTLSRGGIYDVYDMVMGKLKMELKEVQMDGSAISIMFDSWTNKHKRYPYFGLRVGYYVNRTWEYKIVTVSLKDLESTQQRH